MAEAMTAAPFVPKQMNLTALRRAAEECRGCDLYKGATQTVFGQGPRRAHVMLLGEMPGNDEDIEGEPFVGPAGRLLDESLEEAGIERNDVYVTNAVKHFRWEPRGKRRLHKKPAARQIEACRPWLQAEVLVVKPPVIVCLGATAAQTLLGRAFRVTKDRGKFIKSEWAPAIMATYHPSAILRAPDKEHRDRMRGEFVADLRRVSLRLKSAGKSGEA
jgi:uracil-DNA glycosylase